MVTTSYLCKYVLDTLAFIKYHDPFAKSQAKSLFRAIEEFEFHFMARILNIIFDHTGALSDVLQSSDLELDRCNRLTQNTLESFAELRCDDNFENLVIIVRA